MSYPHGDDSLAGRLVREAQEAGAGRYYVTHDGTGRPGYVAIRRLAEGGPLVWSGHVSFLPAMYRNASDPYGRLSRPDSSD
jgi:hypothetical protein